MVTGLDLVELQLIAAEGGLGSARAIHVDRPNGHAIEVRLYAEDPAQDYGPQSGVLTLFEIPLEDGIRVDAGFESGSEVSTHYDAMLAKVVAWAPRRREAARKLAGVLSRARIHGVVTNRDLLVDILTSREFLDENVSTAFLEEWSPAPRRGTSTWRTMACHAATVQRVERLAARRTVQRDIPPGWRNVHSAPQQMSWTSDPSDARMTHDVEWSQRRGRVGFPNADVEVVAIDGDRVRLRFEQDHGSFRIAFTGLDDEIADVDGPGGHVRLQLVPRFTDPADAIPSGSLLAPMPGTVVRVAVVEGDVVEAGAVVLVLEAMKMQHTITAPSAGRVTTLNAQPGQQVAAGDVLAVVEGDDA